MIFLIFLKFDLLKIKGLLRFEINIFFKKVKFKKIKNQKNRKKLKKVLTIKLGDDILLL